MAAEFGHSKPFDHASLILIGLAWSLPFLQSRHGYPLTAFYSEWLAFGLGLAAAMLLVMRRAWCKAELPVVALAPPALALVLGLQAALGRVPYPEQAVTASLYLLWASVLVLLGRVLARELGMATVVPTLAWFLLAGGLLSATAGYVQNFHVPAELDFLVTRKAVSRVYGNLGQPNQFAAYLTMTLCSAAYLYGVGRMRAWLAVACAAWILPALMLSGSRSPWFYLVIIAGLAWLLFRARDARDSRRLFAATLGLLPGFIVAGLFVASWNGGTVSAVTATEPVTSAQRLFQAASGFAPRLELAANAWQLFLSMPLLGAGWGQFAWHHFIEVAAAGTTAAPGVYNHAHNIVLHLLAETGVIGTLVVVSAVALWLVDLKRVRLDPEWWWVLALLAVMGTHSMTENPLWYSYFLGMAAVLLGLGAQRVVRLRRPRIAHVTAGILLLAGWINLVSVISYYRDFERLVFVPGGRDAIKLDEMAFSDAILRIYREPVLTPYVDLAITFGFTMDERSLPEKLALGERALRFAPISYLAYHQALLLALAGERDAALRRFEQAARAYPGELREIQGELAKLSRARPEVFAPLLELAVRLAVSPAEAVPLLK